MPDYVLILPNGDQVLAILVLTEVFDFILSQLNWTL